jgi:hypothetical protein
MFLRVMLVIFIAVVFMAIIMYRKVHGL